MNLIKSISVYTISNISRQAVGFLLLPVITTYLDQGQNGDLSTISAIIVMLTPLVLWSGHGAVNLEYFRSDHGKENFPSYMSSALITPFGIMLLLLILLLFTAPWLSEKLNIAIHWIFLIPVLCAINIIPNFTSTLYQAQKRPIQHSIYNISLTVIDLILAVILIAGFALNWEGRLWAMLASKVTFTIIGNIPFVAKRLFKKQLSEKIHTGRFFLWSPTYTTCSFCRSYGLIRSIVYQRNGEPRGIGSIRYRIQSRQHHLVFTGIFDHGVESFFL